MSSSTEKDEISPTLDSLPRKNLAAWKESIEAAALAYCADLSPDGALGLACDAASWLARHNGVDTPRPVYPDPGPLPAVSTPAERLTHAQALTRFKDFSSACAKLRKIVLVSPVGGPHSTREVEPGNYELRLLGAWPSAKIIAKTLKRP